MSLDFLKVVRMVFRRTYDRASRSLSRYALKSSTCEQVYYESCLACQHFLLQLLIGRVPRE